MTITVTRVTPMPAKIPIPFFVSKNIAPGVSVAVREEVGKVAVAGVCSLGREEPPRIERRKIIMVETIKF
jgi:hypothetical protein